jgi:hypothetical protein
MELLIEGNDISDLIALSKPNKSETARRNTNVFRHGVRGDASRPFADHLVHRAGDGQLLRSKSELFIYTSCLQAGLRPAYEQKLDGEDGSWRLPDFTFVDDAGDPLVWEHLGMLNDPDYAASWARKQVWYEMNGFRLGENLFVTDEVGGLDASKVNALIAKIQNVISG